MSATVYAIFATDDNGNTLIAVNEPLFGGIRSRMARNFGESPPDLYDHHGYSAVFMDLATVSRALPAFDWGIKKFTR